MDVDTHSIGVEEEFFIVDAETRELRPRAERIHEAARGAVGEEVSLELHLAQIETGTPVCLELDELRRHLVRLRAAVAAAAAHHGSRVAALGTHPFADWLGQQINPKERYAELDDTYQLLAWEQLVCGCHVHVGIDDPDLAIQVMDRVRVWLPVLRALFGNSPFWEGVDTGYASYRLEVFDRWPTAGMPPLLGSRAAYDRLVDQLVSTETVPDATKVYWDVRPSARFATLEFRAADVCPRVEEAIAYAALARSLVRVCAAAAREELPFIQPAEELLRAARWRAGRYGLTGTLIELESCRVLPARDVVDRLLHLLRDDLAEHAEEALVRTAVGRLFRDGTGAERQRQAFAATGDLRAVVDTTADETVAECARQEVHE